MQYNLRKNITPTAGAGTKEIQNEPMVDMGPSRTENSGRSDRLEAIKFKIDNNHYNSPQAKAQIIEKLSAHQVFLMPDFACDKFEGYF